MNPCDEQLFLGIRQAGTVQVAEKSIWCGQSEIRLVLFI
jgi:hypothetical protein